MQRSSDSQSTKQPNQDGRLVQSRIGHGLLVKGVGSAEIKIGFDGKIHRETQAVQLQILPLTAHCNKNCPEAHIPVRDALLGLWHMRCRTRSQEDHSWHLAQPVIPPDRLNIANEPIRQRLAFTAVVGPDEKLPVNEVIKFLGRRRHEHQPVPFTSLASIDRADSQMILDIRQLDEAAL
jgi:hypothetical protein